MDRYRVTAPYVIAKTVTSDGPQMKGLYKDALVPDDVSEDWLAHHLRKKMIEKVGQPAPAPAPSRQQSQQGKQPQDSKPAEEAKTPSAAGEPAAPPESGPGSGQKAWVDYAVARGMNRDEAAAMPRDDLIAALREG
jgi:hypothetical protein